MVLSSGDYDMGTRRGADNFIDDSQPGTVYQTG